MTRFSLAVSTTSIRELAELVNQVIVRSAKRTNTVGVRGLSDEALHHAVLPLGLRNARLDDAMFCTNAQIDWMTGPLCKLFEKEPLCSAVPFWKSMEMIQLSVQPRELRDEGIA